MAVVRYLIDVTIIFWCVFINRVLLLNRSGTFFMYRLSYLYYTLVGMTVCIVVGSIVSYFTEPNDPAMVSGFKRFETSHFVKNCRCYAYGFAKNKL